MAVGPTEVVVILLLVFLLFGSRRLSELGKGLGEGIRGFKRGIAGESEEGDESKTKQPEPPRQLAGRVATPEELGEAASSLSPSTIESMGAREAKAPFGVEAAERGEKNAPSSAASTTDSAVAESSGPKSPT